MRRFAAAITALIVIAALLGLPSWAAIAQNSGTTYTVQPNDTLFSIGQRLIIQREPPVTRVVDLWIAGRQGDELVNDLSKSRLAAQAIP